ncbi:MAG TPA: glycerate kinase, partial [Mariprofundaceae bacterium]|nr:glycerate kinase [Mariprofundaceae bacterium]
MLKILIAPDSFKGSLTSPEVARIIDCALAESISHAETVQYPLADGGEGTTEIVSPYLSEDVCLIESATLIGLNLSKMRSLDVLQRGSGALGEAMMEGLDFGKREFVVGLGGSATNDGGLGMLMVLGMQAFDKYSMPVKPDLSGLLSLVRIDISDLSPRLSESRLTILSDVVSPLCGKNGATALYGPQKGLRSSEVGRVDQAMRKFARLCGNAVGFDPATHEGAGAAGGIGFALMLL